MHCGLCDIDINPFRGSLFSDWEGVTNANTQSWSARTVGESFCRSIMYLLADRIDCRHFFRVYFRWYCGSGNSSRCSGACFYVRLIHCRYTSVFIISIYRVLLRTMAASLHQHGERLFLCFLCVWHCTCIWPEQLVGSIFVFILWYVAPAHVNVLLAASYSRKESSQTLGVDPVLVHGKFCLLGRLQFHRTVFGVCYE